MPRSSRSHPLPPRSHGFALSLVVLSLLLTAAPRSAAAADAGPTVDPYAAWWTGSLLATPGHTVPAGHVMIAPYLIYAQPIEARPLRTLSSLILAEAGLTRALDFQIAAEAAYRSRAGASSFDLGATSARLSFQLLEDRHDEVRTPALLFFVAETFPTGRATHLDPARNGTDASGSGAFVTRLGVSAQKVFLPSIWNPVRIRWNLSVEAPSAVSVEGPSVYGGDIDTRGTVIPGKALRALVAGEVHLSPSWVAALDLGYTHVGADAFTPSALAATTTGRTTRAATRVGSPERDAVTVAPAVEYTMREGLGVAGGVALDAGRNVPVTLRPMVAMLMVY